MRNICLFIFTFILLIPFVLECKVVRTFQDVNGQLIDEISIPGTPHPQWKSGPIAQPSRSAVMISDVPAFDWCYGCSATSAAMLAAYYDRGDYPYIYTGTANDGVMPINNANWGPGKCPLSATQQGLDGRLTAGHVDNFWVGNGHHGDDPYGTSNPTGTYGGCLGDYMGTNQDWWDNTDGDTRFFFNNDNSLLTNYMGEENSNPRHRDGTHGILLFFSDVGIGVSNNYNQYIAGYGGHSAGYTFAQYKAMIDSNHPVLIHLEDHTMLGIGYDNTTNTIYMHDTSDHNVHSMVWGGSYNSMQMIGVSIVLLAPSWQPTAPSNLSCTASSSHEIRMTWTDNADSETGFVLERKIYGTDLWVQIISMGTNVIHYNDTDAPEHSLCYYRVRAHNDYGYSNYTNEASAQTPYETPAAPTSLTATALSANRVYLNWIDNSYNETNFFIERRKVSTSEWTSVGNVGTDTVIFYDENASPGTTYVYRVYACRYDKNSTYAYSPNVTTHSLPTAPGNLTATALISSLITLSWSDNSSDETGFRIERSIGTTGTWVELGVVGANVTVFHNAGLTPGITYYYRIRSYNGNGNSPYSNIASAATPPELTNPAPSWLRAQQAGGSNSDFVKALTTDSEGNQYLTGSFTISATFGTTTLTSSGNTDLFVAKISTNGTWQWAVRAGGTGSDGGEGIAIDASGNVFITGFFTGTGAFGTTNLTSSGSQDICVAKLDTNGNWQWASRAGGSSDDEGLDITVGSSGFIYVTGYFKNTSSFGTTNLTSYGDTDVFLGVLGAMGTWATALKAGGIGTDIGYGLIRDNSGNLYLTGSFSGSAIFGSFILISNGSNDIFLAKFNSAGSLVGAVQAGGSGNDYSTDVGVDNSGNVFLTGCFSGTATFGPVIMTSSGSTDIFVARVNPDGYLTGVVAAGGPGADYGKSIAVSDSGYCYITGDFNSTANFGSNTLIANVIIDIFVAKLDSAGNWLWVQQAGGSGNDNGETISLDSAGNCYIAGHYSSSTAMFGDIALTSNQFFEIFDAKLGYQPPQSPSTLTATAVSPDEITLSWVDNASDENGFLIERKTGLSGTWSEIASVAANICSYSDSGLNSGTRYYYRVQSYNVHGYSSYSNESNTDTFLSPPLNFTIIKMVDSLQLSWQAVTGANAYRIYRSTNPYVTDWGSPIAQTSNLYYSATLSDNHYFYKITALYVTKNEK